MADSWRVVTGGDSPEMQKDTHAGQTENPAALAEVERVLHEFQLEDASLFDHTPVLRIQVSEAQFKRAFELRETLVDRIKPLGYRFIALDLDEL